MTDDDLRILVIEALYAQPDNYRRVVRSIARTHGGLPARRLESAFLSAAQKIDATIRLSGSPTDEARAARRMALRLASDIERHTGATLSPGTMTLADLTSSWPSRNNAIPRP